MDSRKRMLAASLLAISVVSEAQETATEHDHELEQVFVIGGPVSDGRAWEEGSPALTPDTATLLRRSPGANFNSNGPLSGMAQFRGLSRMRVSSRINGQSISPGGPNWMDPPLAYAPAAHLDTLTVHRDIASVSAGTETIGGVVDAQTWQGQFGEDRAFSVQGRFRTGGGTVNDATLLSGGVVVANEHHRFRVSGLSERADDAQFPGGEILPTSYERDRYDLAWSMRAGAHEFGVEYVRSETGNSGTPALPMDIAFIDATLMGVHYRYLGASWDVEGRMWLTDINHEMTNFHLRTAPMSGAMFRRNATGADNIGYRFTAASNGWRFGIDGLDERHYSDIDNPNNAAFFVANFNDADRRLIGLFVEKDIALRDSLTLELGARYNRIDMDAGEVDGTPAVMGMAPAVALRDAFNNADRSAADNNVDLVAKLRYGMTDQMSLYVGGGRKTRAPAYQERYLWLPLQATAGLADGRTYTGRIDLESEVSREIEAGFDFTTDRVRLSPRVFYRNVKDYIQGGVSTNDAAIAFVSMMNQMNGTMNAPPLEFQNVDAELYGFDLDWGVRVSDQISLVGVLNYVRGTTANDNLYRVPPLNGFVGVNYERNRWGVTVDSQFAASQDEVAAFNGEPPTDGWMVFGINGHWEMTRRLRLSAGVENLADADYSDHLAGLNRVRGNAAIPVGARLPAFGRNFFARLDMTF